jgi:protein-tyrosine-phosphatase
VHPNALWTLEKYRVPTAGLKPKILATVAREPFDYVITLGDRALERCPIFPRADMLHWSVADPATVSSDSQSRAFDDVFRVLLSRIRLLAAVNERRTERG